MNKNIATIFLLIVLGSCGLYQDKGRKTVSSPGNVLQLNFFMEEGTPYYSINYGVVKVIDFSSLGFELDEAPALTKNMKILKTEESDYFEKWELPWGEKREVVNKYTELKVFLQEENESHRKFNIIFRVYDDGVGFRYEFPEQKNLTEVRILEEHTEFNFHEDHLCWWIPGDWDIYEHLYNRSHISGIDAISKRGHPNLAQTYIPNNAVNTPVTLKTNDGIYISIHEANLTDYAGMTLLADTNKLVFKSVLVGSERTSHKVLREVPFLTPWRTIQVDDTAGRLIESDLILNLNEPNRMGDTEWFKPMKYAGIWWEMHLGKSSWSSEGGKHGATTENAIAMIDFAAQNNIDGVLVEGWNTGWEHWIGFEEREGVFDFVTPYPDYDLEEIVAYGKGKGVKLIMHHETSAAPRTYDEQLDTAFALMKSLGIHMVKTGYVGKIIPKGEYHHGQWMVNHYRKVIETAAQYDVAINAHEPIKATGIRRTYPNAISREGLRGQEFNAWASDGGNPPNHLPTIAFTRMLAGPIDYTPGIFNIKLDPYKKNNQVNTTRAHQLGLYVVIYSPIQMVPDLPEHYEGFPEFQFIRDVGVDWEATKVLHGEIGEFVTIARKEKGSGNWFIGSITNEDGRSITVKLDFLDKDKNYQAIIYQDGLDAHWDTNPNAVEIYEREVNNTSSIELSLAPGGGAAISIRAIEE